MKLILVRYLAFGSNLQFVFDGNVAETIGEFDDADILERVFRQCNHVDGTEWIAGKPLRSMSVGDLVTLIDTSADLTEQAREYQVAGCGWNRTIAQR